MPFKKTCTSCNMSLSKNCFYMNNNTCRHCYKVKEYLKISKPSNSLQEKYDKLKEDFEHLTNEVAYLRHNKEQQSKLKEDFDEFIIKYKKITNEVDHLKSFKKSYMKLRSDFDELTTRHIEASTEIAALKSLKREYHDLLAENILMKAQLSHHKN